MDEHRHRILVTLVFLMAISQVKQRNSFHHSQTSIQAQQKKGITNKHRSSTRGEKNEER
jgi:hypothetical protein